MTGADDIEPLRIPTLWHSQAIYYSAREIKKPKSYKIADTLLPVLELPAIICNAMQDWNEGGETE